MMYIVMCYLVFTMIYIVEKIEIKSIMDLIILLLAPITLPLYLLIGIVEYIGENK